MDDLLPILQKPPYAAPCNGCGYCCKEQACWVSVNLLNSTVAPCIALEHNGERYFCGMLRQPSYYLKLRFNGDAVLQPMIYEVLGVDKGCGAQDPIQATEWGWSMAREDK